MGLSYIKEKAKQFCSWTKERIHDIKIACAEVVSYVAEKAQRWANHVIEENMDWFNVEADVYIDADTIETAKNRIVSSFPNGITETIANQSEEERIKTYQEFAIEAAKDMGLDQIVEDIVFYTPQTEEEMSQFGFFSRHNNNLYINMAFIVCDNVELGTEQVFTIYHELEHARQWAAVCACYSTPPGETFGYPKEKVLEYANNFVYYVTPDENYEDYKTQPVERDAYAFEDELKNFENKRIN